MRIGTCLLTLFVTASTCPEVDHYLLRWRHLVGPMTFIGSGATDLPALADPLCLFIADDPAPDQVYTWEESIAEDVDGNALPPECQTGLPTPDGAP